MKETERDKLSEFFLDIKIYLGKNYRKFVSMFFSREKRLPDPNKISDSSVYPFIEVIKDDVDLNEFYNFINKFSGYFQSRNEIYEFFLWVKKRKDAYKYVEKYYYSIKSIYNIHSVLFFHGVCNHLKKYSNTVDIDESFIIDNDIPPYILFVAYIITEHIEGMNLEKIIMFLKDKFWSSDFEKADELEKKLMRPELIKYLRQLFLNEEHVDVDFLYKISFKHMNKLHILKFLKCLEFNLREVKKEKLEYFYKMLDINKKINYIQICNIFSKILRSSKERDTSEYDNFSYFNFYSSIIVKIINEYTELFFDMDFVDDFYKLAMDSIEFNIILSEEYFEKFIKSDKENRKRMIEEYFQIKTL